MITTRIKQFIERLRDDERGVSPVVGFVLMFALVMIVFTLYQSSVVPNQNEQVEYEHSQTIEGQMEELTAAVASTRPNSAPQSVKLQLGVEYPSRALAINPGNPAGTISTSGMHQVTVKGSTGSADLDTSFIDYQPTYNLKSERTALSIQNGMLIKEFSNGNTLVASEGGLFPANESRINLPLMRGEMQETQMSTIATPSGVTMHTINVSSNSATLDLPTTLSQEQWDSVVADEGQVTDVTVTDGPGSIKTARLDLKDDIAIRANLEAIGDYNSTGSNDLGLDPRITNVTDTSINATNGTTNMTVRTTDIFGSSLNDIAVEASTTGGGGLTPTEASSGEDGELTLNYESDSSDLGGTVDVTASLANRTGENSSVAFTLNYPNADDNTNNTTSREPINSNQIRVGEVNQLKFKITPPSLAISGFSVVTKDDASALNETTYTHQFQITDSKYIPGKSRYGNLRYSSGEPIQFDGQDYVFRNGPRRVVSSEVYLSQWPNGAMIVHGKADSYQNADVVVYFILEDGSRRPVYIDATVPGSSNTD